MLLSLSESKNMFDDVFETNFASEENVKNQLDTKPYHQIVPISRIASKKNHFFMKKLFEIIGFYYIKKRGFSKSFLVFISSKYFYFLHCFGSN